MGMSVKKMMKTLCRHEKPLPPEQTEEILKLIDQQLVPSFEVLSSWSRQKLKFFSHLCTIADFYLGCKCIADFENEVESDSDESAQSMKLETDKTEVMVVDDQGTIQGAQVLGAAASASTS